METIKLGCLLVNPVHHTIYALVLTYVAHPTLLWLLQPRGAFFLSGDMRYLIFPFFLHKFKLKNAVLFF